MKFLLGMFLFLGLNTSYAASSEHLKDPNSKQAYCSMYANNFTSGAWARFRSIPKLFKNLPREKYELYKQEHSGPPGDAMYIIEMDAMPPDRKEVVQGQMLDGYKMMEENIGHLHGEEPDWKGLLENMYNICMNGDRS
jgi:hypothetical protein